MDSAGVFEGLYVCFVNTWVDKFAFDLITTSMKIIKFTFGYKLFIIRRSNYAKSTAVKVMWKNKDERTEDKKRS